MIEFYDDVDDEEVAYRCDVDLSLYDEAPQLELPTLLWIFVKVDDPRGEAFNLFRQDLIDTLHTTLGSVYAGSITKDGWCEFYFYASTAKTYANITAEVISRHGSYPYECSASRDAKWEFYLERLYPDPHAALMIQNRHTIEALLEAGDTLALPREVEHYLFFQTKSALERLVQSLEPHGFVLKEYLSDDESDYSYGAALIKNESITPEQVEETTSMLYDAALQEHGHYEGWSTILAG